MYDGLYSYLGSAYTHPLHPTYVSVYVNIALIMLFVELISGKKKNLFFLPIFILFIIIASSKLAIILLIFNILLCSIFLISKSWISIKNILVTIVVFLATIYLVFQNPTVSSKFTEARNSIEIPINESVFEDPSYHPSSSNQRLVAWEASIDIIKQNYLIGVGSGDYLDCMVAQYKKNGNTYLQKKRLDSHQQFLQTYAELGIIPLLILLSIFLTLVVVSAKNKSLLLFMFASNFFIFGITESFLERQAGLIFFLFFLYLLTNKKILNGN
jgi:O-antigen ligase